MPPSEFCGSFDTAGEMHEIVRQAAGSYIEAAVRKNDGKHTNMELVVMYCWACATVAVFFGRFEVITEEQGIEYLNDEEKFLFGLTAENHEKSLRDLIFEEFDCAFLDLMARLSETVDLIFDSYLENRDLSESNVDHIKAFFDESYEDFVPPARAQMDRTLVSFFVLILVAETIRASMKEINKRR